MGRHISAGFPGVLDQSLKDALGPQCVTLFSNGGGGNVQHMEYLTPEPRHKPDMDAIGRALAEHVDRALPAMVFSPAPRLAVREVTVALRYREGLEDLAAHAEDPGYFPGILGGLIERGWYAWSVEQLRAAHAAGSGVDVPVQAIGVGPAALVGIPAEYFSDSVLAIKARSPIRHTWMLSTTNGWLGYVPAPAAFARRGGHESTLAWWSKMAPETGDRLADAALESLRGLEAAHSGARADAGSQPPSAPAP